MTDAMSGTHHDQLVLEAVKRLGDGMNYGDNSLDCICAAQHRTTSAADRLTAAVDRQERATRDLHGDLSTRSGERGRPDRNPGLPGRAITSRGPVRLKPYPGRPQGRLSHRRERI